MLPTNCSPLEVEACTDVPPPDATAPDTLPKSSGDTAGRLRSLSIKNTLLLHWKALQNTTGAVRDPDSRAARRKGRQSLGAVSLSQPGGAARPWHPRGCTTRTRQGHCSCARVGQAPPPRGESRRLLAGGGAWPPRPRRGESRRRPPHRPSHNVHLGAAGARLDSAALLGKHREELGQSHGLKALRTGAQGAGSASHSRGRRRRPSRIGRGLSRS
jgi:hypothetical protein